MGPKTVCSSTTGLLQKPVVVQLLKEPLKIYLESREKCNHVRGSKAEKEYKLNRNSGGDGEEERKKTVRKQIALKKEEYFPHSTPGFLGWPDSQVHEGMNSMGRGRQNLAASDMPGFKTCPKFSLIHCGDLNGEKNQKGGDTWLSMVCMVESFSCSVKTNNCKATNSSIKVN